MAVATETITTPASSSTSVPDKINGVATKRGYEIAERGVHNITMSGEKPYPVPVFEDKYKEREYILEHMAGAFRIFARKGYTEGTAGHISVRDPVDPDTFWINPLGKHFALMKAEDMVHVNEKGEVIGGSGKAINAAGFAIHSALHKHRRDINAACHTHSPYGKAYSAFGKPLDMINQDVCSFYKSHAVYQDFGGVAIEAKEGEEIAKAIGDGTAAILQNHGLITVGQTVDEAAYLFTLMERSCQVQLEVDAASAGGFTPTVIGDEEAAYTHHMAADPETLFMEFQPDYDLEVELSNGAFQSFSKHGKPCPK